MPLAGWPEVTVPLLNLHLVTVPVLADSTSVSRPATFATTPSQSLLLLPLLFVHAVDHAVVVHPVAVSLHLRYHLSRPLLRALPVVLRSSTLLP